MKGCCMRALTSKLWRKTVHHLGCLEIGGLISMGASRKTFNLCLLSVSLYACGGGEAARQSFEARSQLSILDALTPIDAPVDASLPLSLAAIRDGKTEPETWVTGRGKAPPQAINRPMRVASISKLAVAIVAMSLVEDKLLDLDQDVSDILGWTLRHPLHPDVPITARFLLSHQSGLTDGAEYQADLPASLELLMADERFFELPYAPGTYFKYANINYGVLATVMETVSQTRFDVLMQKRLFEPAGLDVGFNWHGVSLSRQAQAIPVGRYGTLRTIAAAANEEGADALPESVVITIDGEPVGPSPKRRALDSYIPGTNATVFSPQGGMRASLLDLVALGEIFITKGKINDARILRSRTVKAMVKEQWRFSEDDNNGDSYDGLMRAFGLGVHIYQPKDTCFPSNGARYYGHFGEAYGLLGGLLVDPKADKTIAYLFPYTPDDAADQVSACSGLYVWEERLLKTVLAPKED